MLVCILEFNLQSCLKSPKWTSICYCLQIMTTGPRAIHPMFLASSASLKNGSMQMCHQYLGLFPKLLFPSAVLAGHLPSLLCPLSKLNALGKVKVVAFDENSVTLSASSALTHISSYLFFTGYLPHFTMPFGYPITDGFATFHS